MLAPSISPDGRYLLFIDRGEGRNLVVRDLATGKNRRLTNKQADGAFYYTHSRFSPEGTQIAYIYWPGCPRCQELCIMGPDGSGSKTLYRTQEGGGIYTIGGWSPDGKYISAILRYEMQTKNQIVMISVADGSLRILKTLDRPVPRLSHFSPDGRYIVYDSAPQVDSPQADIFLLATDGSHEVPLVEHPANDCVLDWTPDGDFLFSSDRTGTDSMWIIQVKDGRPQGAPELIKPDIGQIRPLVFTSEGSFYYNVNRTTSDVYIATLDPQTSKLLSPPAKVSKSFTGSNQWPAWSPDGKYLAYRSLPLSAGATSTSRNAIVILSVDTGKERRILPKFTSSGAFSIDRIFRWFPDGHSILAMGGNWNRKGFFKINIQTGDVTSLYWGKPDELISWAATLSPDGKTIFYLAEDSDASSSLLMALDIETGQKKEITKPDDPFSQRIFIFAVSPDGQKLVFPNQERVPNSDEILIFLKVIPITGGEPVELMRLKTKLGKGIRRSGLVWTSDGAHLLYWRGRDNFQIRYKSDKYLVELWRVSAEGGEPEKLGLAMENVAGLCIHPDGRRIAFHNNHVVQEIWLLENFLPKKKQEER